MAVLQEASRWREESQRLQAEVGGLREGWRSERGRLLLAKDEERRVAVTGVRSECQEDYRRFMEESKATLDSALDSARRRHQQEMVSAQCVCVVSLVRAQCVCPDSCQWSHSFFYNFLNLVLKRQTKTVNGTSI